MDSWGSEWGCADVDCGTPPPRYWGPTVVVPRFNELGRRICWCDCDPGSLILSPVWWPGGRCSTGGWLDGSLLFQASYLTTLNYPILGAERVATNTLEFFFFEPDDFPARFSSQYCPVKKNLLFSRK